ncbi:MAG: response regulator [Thiolinea sp.]
MENNTNKTLLIIDDDQALVDRLLSLFGGIYDSHVAFTGETGLQLYSKLKKEKPVVICDVNLPDITGFDVCRSIKSEESGTYVMLFTAYNDESSACQVMKLMQIAMSTKSLKMMR